MLIAAALSALLTWLVFRVTNALPARARARAMLGTADTLVDLADDVDPERDHIRGPHEAPVTLVEYGDFECPYCGRAEPIVRELLAEHGDVRYVWRHLPLHDVHPRAQLAAEASEAAAAQGTFWEMHDLLLERQDALTPRRPGRLRRRTGARRRALPRRPPRARRRRPHRRRRRRRRPVRRLRHTDVLHQRPPPPRRLRHRHAECRGQGGGRPGDAGRLRSVPARARRVDQRRVSARERRRAR